MTSGSKYVVGVAFALGLAGLVLGLTGGADGHLVDVQVALAEGELNEEFADSAPQQQVVNGWIARDLLEIQAAQLDDLAQSQERTNLMLGFVALMIALAVAALISKDSWSRSDKLAGASVLTIPVESEQSS